MCFTLPELKGELQLDGDVRAARSQTSRMTREGRFDDTSMGYVSFATVI